MKLAAFADEISPELDEQIKALLDNGVRLVDLRGVWGKNVLDFDKNMRAEIKSKFESNGIRVVGIGSPIGKVKINEPWQPHFDRFKIAVEMAEFFGAPLIRIFSYYPPEKDQDMTPHRDEVMRRMQAKVDFIKNHPVTLVHENEKGIYGDTGPRCLDIHKTVSSPKLRNAFDFANFVQIKDRPLDDWPLLKPYTVHIHVKDARLEDAKVVPVGQGDGQVEPILVDLHKSGYTGCLSLEPHLKAAGQFSGFSGPNLFKVAVDAIKGLCAKNGIPLAQ
jgi:3-dehydroshikimate dehydratase